MDQWIDSPLTSEGLDQLARGPFAKLVADTLLRNNPERATIVGLTGGWGSGKSTVANFVASRIHESGSMAKVIRFEPWMVGTSEALVREFFRELGRKVLPKGSSPAERSERTRFYTYSALCLDALGLTTSALSSLGVPGAGLADTVFSRIKDPIKLAAAGLEVQAALPTLREAKETLRDSLATLGYPVVIIIDDIDRLDAEETRTVFRLLKACADFPNLRYLLLYDREQVLHALEGQVCNPDAFLEKIVGPCFDLPIMTRAQRAAVLNSAVSEFGFGPLDQDAQSRLEAVTANILLPAMETVRTLRRFTGTVAALLPGVIVDGHRNVDPSDFLILELIRQQFPDLYLSMRDEESPAIGGEVMEILTANSLSERRAKARDQLLSSVSETKRELALEAVKHLEGGLHDNGSGRTGLKAERDRRFACPNWKPVYFGFSYARATLSEREWRDFLDSLTNQQLSDEWFESIGVSEAWPDYRRAVCNRIADLNQQQATYLFDSLLCWTQGQQATLRKGDWFYTGPIRDTDSMMTSCLAQLYSLGFDTIAYVKEHLSTKEALYPLACLCGSEYQELQRSSGSGDWSDRTRFEPLRVQILGLVRERVDSNAVFAEIAPSDFLMAWYWLEGEKVYRKWFVAMIEDPPRLAMYVNSVMGPRRRQPEFSGWGGSDTDFIDRVLALDESLLSEDGRWAKASLEAESRTARFIRFR